ncbi:MAG TPA: hypothetical protein VGC07_02690 [Granulicella sp.]
MTSILNRRSFLQLCSAGAAFLTRSLHAQPQIRSVVPLSKTPAKSRKNVVAIQVRGFAWVDEGIDQVLDNIQQKGNVNTLWCYTFGYGEQRLKKGATLPDHGIAQGPGNSEVIGGAFYDYDPKYFQGTFLKDFRTTGYGKLNVIEQVAPKAKARGLDFIAWDLNNPSPALSRSVPNYVQVSEIDAYGRRTGNPCFNHPDYRAFLGGKVQSVLGGYRDLVDGYAWGSERSGPLEYLLGGSNVTTCFCQFCQAKARERGISVARAQAGYRELSQLFEVVPNEQRPADGYFAAFWRLLLKYPEILSWETLWVDSYQETRAELYGIGKALSPEKPFGFHLMQAMTFSPFFRAEEDYTRLRNNADFLKIACYNNAGGPRLAAYLDNLSHTIFRDAKPQEFLELYYRMMNFNEAPYDQLAHAGLSPDYVAKETKRAVDAVAGQTKIYPGIDIEVPVIWEGPHANDKRTTPEDVRKALQAAFTANADGVVLAREYVEMHLANLTAAGDTLRELLRAPAKS